MTSPSEDVLMKRISAMIRVQSRCRRLIYAALRFVTACRPRAGACRQRDFSAPAAFFSKFEPVKFPENREFNREFFRIRPFGAFFVSNRSDKSMACTRNREFFSREQGISLTEQGILRSEQGIALRSLDGANFDGKLDTVGSVGCYPPAARGASRLRVFS